jgi:hypothetical protein
MSEAEDIHSTLRVSNKKPADAGFFMSMEKHNQSMQTANQQPLSDQDNP